MADMEGLDPEALADKVSARKSKAKPPSEIDVAKEKRLAAKEERLQNQEKVMNAPPPPPAPVVDKSLLLDKLHAYRERFPHVQSRNKVSARSSVDEIEDELHFVEKQLAGGKMDAGMQVLVMGLMGFETFTRDVYNPLGLDLTGLGTVAQANSEQFQDIVDELMIKYGSGMSVGPEMRLAVAVGTLMYTVHMSNTNGTLARAMAAMGQKKPE